MKLLNFVLSLTVASSAFSYSISKRHETNEQCEKETLEYGSCITERDPNYRNDLCSEKCIQLNKNPFQYLPSCKGDASLEEYFSHKGLMPYNYELICAKDESGNFCPLLRIYKEDNFNIDEILSENCKSKICTDNAAVIYDNLLKNIKYPQLEQNYKHVYDYIKSDKCTANNNNNNTSNNNTSNNTSDATTIKVGTTLMISLALLLLSYF